MIDVTLNTIHLGLSRRVVTLGLDGKDDALIYLQNLAKSNLSGFESIRSCIRAVSDYERFENDRTFNSLGDGIYEFKRPGLRLYAFYYNHPDGELQLIIASNGGTKNRKQEQQSDVARAKNLRQKFLNAIKENPIHLITLPHEN